MDELMDGRAADANLYTSCDWTRRSSAPCTSQMKSSMVIHSSTIAEEMQKSFLKDGVYPEDEELDLYRSAEEIGIGPLSVIQTSSSASKCSDITHKKHQIILLRGNSVSQKKDATDNNEPNPSAAQDVAKVYMKVDWPGELPPRWKNHLQKALQTWCNSDLSYPEKQKCSVLNLQLTGEQRSAQVEITPSTALKGIKSATLTFRQLDKRATVHLQEDAPESENNVSIPKVNMTVTAMVDTENFSPEILSVLMKRFRKQQVGTKLHISGSLAEINTFYREVCETVGAVELKCS